MSKTMWCKKKKIIQAAIQTTTVVNQNEEKTVKLIFYCDRDFKFSLFLSSESILNLRVIYLILNCISLPLKIA